MSAPALLVVDDDEGVRLLMANALQSAGYRVETAANARETLARLDRHPPDLLVLDLKLPDGGGPELIARLQRDRAAVPFVVVTGRGDEKAAVEVMKQGALDYVMKNSELLEHLPAVVRRALDAVARDRALGAAQAEHRRLEREILDISERERQSIGADLHDNLGQQLTALELMCTLAKEDAASHPELAERLNVMSRMLREAVAQTRFLARGLVPVGADPDALQLGLAELAERTGAIGKLRCIGVRCANCVLWYAWPNSCAVVWAESTLPLQLSSTNERSLTNDMQNAPPTLPSRGSASIHCSLSERSTKPARRSL